MKTPFRRTRGCLLAITLGTVAVWCVAQAPVGQTSTQPPGAPPAPTPSQQQPSPAAQQPSGEKKPARQPSGGERRRAEKLFLAAAKLYESGRFEEAFRNDQEAADLDPANTHYRAAAEVAREHAVTALIQAAAKHRMQGDTMAARTTLAHAFELDPHNPQLAQHSGEFGGDPLSTVVNDERERATSGLGDLIRLEPAAGRHSFHLRANQRQVIDQVLRAYGISATLDESVRSVSIRFDMDDATFEQATHTLSLVTTSFLVPIDAHRAVVALDTRDNRGKFTRNGVETIYLSGLTPTEMTDMGNLAKNVFEVTQSAVNPTAGTLTLRAPESQLKAFNATFGSLMDGRSQVMLDVKLIQLAHNRTLDTGTQIPQQVTAFNVYAEEQSILSANEDLVQEIISSGLAAPGDTLAILGILLASGQVSSSIFENGIIVFGGGLTLSGVSPQPLSVNLNLNSSDSRELDQFQLRLGDGEEGTLKSGTRYPITTSSYSSLGTSSSSIAGLTSAGLSSNLSSLAASLSTSANIPMVQYEDLGLTLKATPSVMRSGQVALKIDMKISALAGTSINDVPVLANRAWTGVVTIPENQTVVVVSEMDKSESRSVSGTPGLSEIPGLNNITGKDSQKNYASLVILITPHIVRSPRNADHTRMVRIERNVQAR